MMMKDVAILRELQATITACEPCPERDRAQVRFDLMVRRLEDCPRRVADRSPFATGAEAEVVLREELEFALAAWEAPH
jgi:hypothetical protein